MPIPSRLVSAGIAPNAANTICGDVTNALTATGTTNADALQLTSSTNVITTAAAGTGVKLLVPEVVSRMTVVNAGANALLVYPGTGVAINALAVTTAGFSIAAGGRALFFGTSGTQWYALLSA